MSARGGGRGGVVTGPAPRPAAHPQQASSGGGAGGGGGGVQFHEEKLDVLLDGSLAILTLAEAPKDVLTIKYTEDYRYIAAGSADGVVRLFEAEPAPLPTSPTTGSAPPMANSIHHNYYQQSSGGASPHHGAGGGNSSGGGSAIGGSGGGGGGQHQMHGTSGGIGGGGQLLAQQASQQLAKILVDADVDNDKGSVTGIKHRPMHKNYQGSNTLICTYANGCVKCWNYNFDQCVYTIRENRQALGLAYHPRLPKFVTCGDDGRLFLYDEETRTQERILHKSDNADLMDGHTSRVFAACFNPRSNHELISGGWDDTVMFWDTRHPQATRHISGVHTCADGLDVSRDGTAVLTCSWQRQRPMQLWDYGSGRLLQTLEPDPHASMLYCGRYITRDYAGCGGSDANLLRIVDLRGVVTVGAMRNLPSGVYAFDTGPAKQPPKQRKGGHKGGGGTGSTPAQSQQQLDRGGKGAAVGASSMNVELQQLPKVAFCSGKRIYQVELY